MPCLSSIWLILHKETFPPSFLLGPYPLSRKQKQLKTSEAAVCEFQFFSKGGGKKQNKQTKKSLSFLLGYPLLLNTIILCQCIVLLEKVILFRVKGIYSSEQLLIFNKDLQWTKPRQQLSQTGHRWCINGMSFDDVSAAPTPAVSKEGSKHITSLIFG